MRTAITTKPVIELSADEYRQCWSLNLRGNGALQWYVRVCRDDSRWRGTAFMLRDCHTRQLLAWGLTYHDPVTHYGKKRVGAQLYVRRAYRRQGYGQRLMRAMYQRHATLDVYPWDDRSRAFFAATASKRHINAHYETDLRQR